MIVKYSPAFFDKLKKVDVRIRKSIKERILIFSKDPNYPQLNNHSLKHSLKREHQGYRSIDITADYRALYQEKQEGEEVIAYFVALGTHEELYGTE